ncbi:MAG: glycosyl transferase, partial [Bacteroidetes bacterium]|nr:glycosyl transferase [Bacteroidota bacterium]
IRRYLSSIKDFQFEIFSKEVDQPVKQGNLLFIPVSKNLFNRSLINCHGIITSAGFETPAEALFLQKKLMVIPIKGQYEQLCNAVALEEMGVKKINALNANLNSVFADWINAENKINYEPEHSTEQIIRFLMQRAMQKNNFPIQPWHSNFALN